MSDLVSPELLNLCLSFIIPPSSSFVQIAMLNKSPWNFVLHLPPPTIKKINRKLEGASDYVCEFPVVNTLKGTNAQLPPPHKSYFSILNSLILPGGHAHAYIHPYSQSKFLGWVVTITLFSLGRMSSCSKRYALGPSSGACRSCSSSMDLFNFHWIYS